MPAFLLRAGQCLARKSKNPGEFPHRGSWLERPARVGNVAEGPEQSCTGLFIVQIVDSRPWHGRSFPVKNTLVKMLSCDSALDENAVSNVSSIHRRVLLFFVRVPAMDMAARFSSSRASCCAWAAWPPGNRAGRPARSCRSADSVRRGMAHKARTAAGGSFPAACCPFPGCSPCRR
ncbi:hypothetical protein SAMN04515619_106200 [Collimonas sp. OK412]|nr:hypothetical protein SAMN04515619_106200 [Collimonas sp. OK412]